MEHDLLIRQHDQLVQRAQELASASKALASSMAGDEAATPGLTAYELLTNLMNTLMAMTRTTEGLRVRLVASLCRTGIGLAHGDFVAGETRDRRSRCWRQTQTSLAQQHRWRWPRDV